MDLWIRALWRGSEKQVRSRTKRGRDKQTNKDGLKMGREIQEKGRGGRGAKEKRGNERESPNILGPIQGAPRDRCCPPAAAAASALPRRPDRGTDGRAEQQVGFMFFYSLLRRHHVQVRYRQTAATGGGKRNRKWMRSYDSSFYSSSVLM